MFLQRLAQRADYRGDLPLDRGDAQLRHLLADTERAFAANPPQRLDPDPVLLHQLVDCDEARMSWDELRSIRRYTINFNPAIEVESNSEARPSPRPSEGAEGRSLSGI